jgi:5-methylcytosine-specific restriction endonuclease McrA
VKICKRGHKHNSSRCPTCKQATNKRYQVAGFISVDTALQTKKCRICKHVKTINKYGRGAFICRVCKKLPASVRSYIIHKKEVCEECAFVPINICQLQVDHIDGNHENNDLSNLKTMCANCHILKTFLNKEHSNKKLSEEV